TNKKTNAFNKTDEEACNWVFLSAMIVLKERAIKEGGNAVVDIKSNYKNNLTSSVDTFQCGAGTMVAGVALTGKVVKLK
ncbi:excinuclease, partial [Vibrio vulnificus]